MSERPNFILLIGEDTGLHLGCCGDPCASTPHLDRLATEGARYTNAVSTAPVCAPARSTLVTGMYAWSLGTHHMRSTLLQPPRLFTHELRDAGYYVSWPTKTDFNFQPPANFADSTEGDWLEALRDGTLPDKPFLLCRNFTVTHESTMWAELPEGQRFGALRERNRELHRLAPQQRHDPAEVVVPAYLPDTPEVRNDIARYYDALSIQDMQIAEVLDALEQSPYRENTIVIYLTDHGRGLVREKRWCYDAGVHLPLIVRDPRPEGESVTRRGAVRDEAVSWVDVAPTILSLAGASIPAHYQGNVFLGPARRVREYAFFGRDRMDEVFDRVRGCRDGRYHLIRNDFPQLPYAQRNHYMEYQATTRVIRDLHAAGKLPAPARLWMADRKPPQELYDWHADPDMVHNLADDPAHATTLERMRSALAAELERFGDLGEKTERQLIDSGIVENRLDSEYAARVAPLAEAHRIGGRLEPVLEIPDPPKPRP